MATIDSEKVLDWDDEKMSLGTARCEWRLPVQGRGMALRVFSTGGRGCSRGILGLVLGREDSAHSDVYLSNPCLERI